MSEQGKSNEELGKVENEMTGRSKKVLDKEF